MRNIKRVVALFLTVVLLLSSVSAADVIVPGTGTDVLAQYCSTANDSPFSCSKSGDLYPGMLVHVEKMSIPLQYSDTPSTDTGRATYEVSNWSDVLSYWCTHFPNTNQDQNPASTDPTHSGIYILPTWVQKSPTSNNTYSIVMQANGAIKWSYRNLALAEEAILAHTVTTTSGQSNAWGKAAYNTARRNMSTANPNYTLSPTYWSDLISSATRSNSLSLLAHLYGTSDAKVGYTSNDITAVNARIAAFLGTGTTDPTNTISNSGYSGAASLTGADRELAKDIVSFFNYCSFLAVVIRCLPNAAERVALAKELDSMCQAYLSGKEFYPLVVTGEILAYTEYNNTYSNCGYSCWWTPQQCIRAVTGQYARDLTTYGSFTAFGRSCASMYSTMSGGVSMYGIPTSSSAGWKQFTDSGGSNYPVYSKMITSVAKSLLQQSGISVDPIPGFGVWGLSTDFAKIIPTPPSASASSGSGSGSGSTVTVAGTALGTTAIKVIDPKLTVAESTDYNLATTVQASVNISEATVNVNGVDTPATTLADCFAALNAYRLSGYTFPDPEIHIYAKYADPITALDDSTTQTYLSNPPSSDTLTWNNAIDVGGFAPKFPDIDGLSWTTKDDGRVVITFADLGAAMEYFETSNGTFTLEFEIPDTGNVAENSTNQHWFKIGTYVKMSTPNEVGDGANKSAYTTGTFWLSNEQKYDVSTVTRAPVEELPYFYSTYQTPYSEFKQGTVSATSGGSVESFNAMTGTPTVTEDTYYHYFASGGSEFVVQFDGEFHYNETATRTFVWKTSGVATGSCQETIDQGDCPHLNDAHTHTQHITGYTSGDDPQPIYCEDCEAQCTAHSCGKCGNPWSVQHPHGRSEGTATATYTYTGLSYVKITNLKVWKLSQAKLDGTYELLEQSEITASVQTTAPGVSYNIAGSNTAAAGRMVYAHNPTQLDRVVHTVSVSVPGNECGSVSQPVIDAITADAATIDLGAWMISDYIVLHTSNGNQSIMYFEEECKRPGEMMDVTVSCGQSCGTYGTNAPSISVSINNDPMEFPMIDRDAETARNLLWYNNPYSSEGCGLPVDGITYGGYTGDYSNVNTKYKSFGYPANMTSWTSTQVYKNTSGVFTGSRCYRSTVSKVFRLMKSGIAIPDTKQNGLYELGDSYVFYENIVNRGSETPNFSVAACSGFSNKKGFVLSTTYSPEHDDINDVVVYNPVSVQNAILISLPEERDQRIGTSGTGAMNELNPGCPGDMTCDHLRNDCSVTNHIHTESCYSIISYEVAGPNNAHVHTDDCYTYASHTHTSDCPRTSSIYYCTSTSCYTWRWDSETQSTVKVYYTGGHHHSYTSYTCGNLPLNSGKKQVCDGITPNTHICGYVAHTWESYSSTMWKCSTCGETRSKTETEDTTSCGANGLTVGSSVTYNYTGAMQQITLQPGTYILEAWGARGGGYGGYGGYSKGTLTLTKTTTVYIGVGGYPIRSSSGGYNGGGDGYYGGGGATHFATANGVLSSLSSNRSAILLVAGGGGASAEYFSGGVGGGANAAGSAGEYYLYGEGGTLSAGGTGGEARSSWAGSAGSAGSFGAGGDGGESSGRSDYGGGRYGEWWQDAISGSGGGGGYFGGGGGGAGEEWGEEYYDAEDDRWYGYHDCENGAGGGGSGYASSVLSAVSGTSGSNSGAGYAKITAVAIQQEDTDCCYEMHKAVLTCTDPHHAYSYNWKLYTYGLTHESGTVCSGRSCTDTTPITFPTQEQYTIAQCKAGKIVQHTNGNVHLTCATNGTCSYCGQPYSKVLSNAQTSDRTPSEDEYSCYTYGDSRCWKPCGDDANHETSSVVTSSDGASRMMATFINLDWKFDIYFPNTGDFYGTGAKTSSETSAERGWGYRNGMDCTQWTKAKWVQFPFDVVYSGVTYPANTRIYLEVEEVNFSFYLPLGNVETAAAEIQYGAVAINSPYGVAVDCATNATRNTQVITSNGKTLAHPHSADKRSYVDVVGRIGALTMEDTGDYRFSNLFKQVIENGWLVPNIVKKVDTSKQAAILTDFMDVRGMNASPDTYGTVPAWDSSLRYTLPLRPAVNNIDAIDNQPLRIGYSMYMDFTTIGNYYGNVTLDAGGGIANRSYSLIRPYYFGLTTDGRTLAPLDVYMLVEGEYVLCNDYDEDITHVTSMNALRMDWTKEAARRNYGANESTVTNAVAEAAAWVTIPSSQWTFGNYDLLNLTDRNRTFIGSRVTNGTTIGNDNGSIISSIRYQLQAQRWHFTVGLPSSAVFVEAGKDPTTANIEACASKYACAVLALEITMQGDIWQLAYDGALYPYSINNQEIEILEGSGSFTFSELSAANGNILKYRDTDIDMEMPVVAILSIDHSSKEDLSVSGTH